jgi:DNA ligase-1
MCIANAPAATAQTRNGLVKAEMTKASAARRGPRRIATACRRVRGSRGLQSPSQEGASVDAFAFVADEVAATTRKLEKRSILAAYLRALPGESLPIAAVFLTGRPFPLCSEQTVQVGGALVREAVAALTGAAAEAFDAMHVAHGDAGDAAGELLTHRPQPSTSLTLVEALRLCEALAKAATPSERLQTLVGALAACRAPAARYLVKVLTGTIRIGVQESLVEEALAEAFGQDPAGVRRANMLLGDLGATAVLAREGRLAGARLTLFRPLKFMLATALDRAEDAFDTGPAWLAEDKFDGIRCQLHTNGRDTRLYSRTLDEITHQFPELPAVFDGCAGELVCDGELVAEAEGRQLGFGELSRRVGRKRPDEGLMRKTPVSFIVFDVLAQDGRPLLDEPLSTRRERLADLPRHASMRMAEAARVASAGEVDAAFEAALERGNEGLMLKDPASAYLPGKRGRAWLKLKRPLATLDVVVVAAEWGHGKRRGLLSDYTFAVRNGDQLATVGKAYSGLTDREIAFLTEHFRAGAVRDLGRGVLVAPTIVLEVAFNGVQRSARHGSGYALRFPRIRRLRLDKPVHEIDTLERVQELWAQQGERGEHDAGSA